MGWDRSWGGRDLSDKGRLGTALGQLTAPAAQI